MKRPIHEMHLISASINGELLWWDLRASKPLHRLMAYPQCGLLALDVHGEGGLSMVAGADQTVKIYDSLRYQSVCVGNIKIKTSTMSSHFTGNSRGSAMESLAMELAGLWHGHHSSPINHSNHHHHHNATVSSMAWHPRRLLCAVGLSDGSISLYSQSK